MDYKAIFKKLSESDFDDEVLDEPLEDEVTSEVESDVVLGSVVKVLDTTSYTAEELFLTDEEFQTFQTKVEDGLTAIVFDIDDEHPELVDIVFEDGLEIFKIPKINLEVTEYESIEEDEIV